MTYQIDQSGKIEQTERNTVIAYSNGSQHTVLIHRKTKRQIQEIFRGKGMTKQFIYHTFAVCVYLLIKNIKEVQKITIDLEYPGKDRVIKQIIANLLSKNSKPAHDIHFARIGNRPKVHYAAKNVFDKKKQADEVLSLEKILRGMKMADGRLRGCFSTLVGAQPRPIRKNIAKKTGEVKKEAKK